MEHANTPERETSRPSFADLEAWVRRKIQAFIQALLEEEVTAGGGRRPGLLRRLRQAPPAESLQARTITLRRPRLRGLEERFESRVLPLFSRRTQAVGGLLPELYLHGLAQVHAGVQFFDGKKVISPQREAAA